MIKNVFENAGELTKAEGRVGFNFSNVYEGSINKVSKAVTFVPDSALGLISKSEASLLIITFYATIVLISAFIFNSPAEIIQGMAKIIISPSILISDYIAIGNLGSAFFNSGLLMMVAILITTKSSNVEVDGKIIAAVLTIGGFAFFGKNIYNVWALILGVYIYAKIRDENFGDFILVALFGTALGPLVSQISFGFELPIWQGMILGNLAGIVAGLILPSLATHAVKFHQGFNLYNIGFTAGLVGAFFMSLLRALGAETPSTLIIAEGYNNILSVYLLIMFLSMMLFGYLLNNKNFKGYKSILDNPGLSADFVKLNGLGITLINMGILGLLSTFYILLVNGELNGPILAGIFTVVGFGAFGKHVKNIIPIFIGIYIASLFQIWDINSTGALLAALFGTTLAPISGKFGWKSGVAAGILHMAIVMNVGHLHGGMNLYNNGFSGGIVAAILVTFIISLKTKNEAIKN